MAMLETLQALDSRKTASILAAVVQETGGAVPLLPYTRSEDLEGYVKDVIAEIRQKLNISPGDNSRRAAKAIDEMILKEMKNAVFTSSSEEEVLQHAARLGRLSPSSYKVEFENSFNSAFKVLGAYKSAVENVVLRPDDYQHLMVDPPFIDESDLFSLFVKRGDRSEFGAHWLLVQTLRKGIVQRVQSAWWVHGSVVDLRGANTPLDVLKAFVDKFGIPISMNGIREKYIEDVTLPKARGEPAEFDIQVEMNTDEYFWTASNRVRLEDDFFKVGIAYCIDLKKYRSSLREIGAI